MCDIGWGSVVILVGFMCNIGGELSCDICGGSCVTFVGVHV